ncbi:MAG TPA: arylesterase [Zeimonas sp.]
MFPFRESRRRFVETLLATSAAVAASLPVPGSGADASSSSGKVASAGTVLVLGDSLSAEYGLRRGSGWVERAAERLRERQPPWSLVNASISGETTAGGRSRIESLLRRHEPQIVVVELGGNDALRGLDLRSTEANLDAIVGASVRMKARVLVLGMQVPPNYGPTYADAFAAIFPRVAERHRTALVPFFLAPIAGEMRWFQPDRIHPTEDAQPLLFDTVWPALEPLLRASATR